DFNPWQNVVFTDLANTSTADEPGLGGRLEKTGGGTGWDADAASTELLGADGEVRFQFTDTNANVMAGLGVLNASRSYTDIDYAIYGSVGGVLSVYESGSSKGSFGSFTTTDVFSIERSGAAI